MSLPPTMLMCSGTRLCSIFLPPRWTTLLDASNTSVLSETHHYGDGNPSVPLRNGLPEQVLPLGSEVSDNWTSSTVSLHSSDKPSIGLSEVENGTEKGSHISESLNSSGSLDLTAAQSLGNGFVHPSTYIAYTVWKSNSNSSITM